MKNIILSMLLVFFLLCACGCGQTQPETNLQFPGISWDMNLEEVGDALNIQKKDILHLVLGSSTSTLRIGNYRLFGEKTKNIEFTFMNLDAWMEEDFRTESWSKRQKHQELHAGYLSEIDNRLLELSKAHKLETIYVEYYDDTNMENVLNHMIKIYGDTIPEISIYENIPGMPSRGMLGSPQLIDLTDSEQIKLWGTDFVTASIPSNKSIAFRDGWKPFDFNRQISDYREDGQGVSWDMFLTTARMQSIVYQNQEDRKQLTYWAHNANVFHTLQQKMNEKQKGRISGRDRG